LQEGGVTKKSSFALILAILAVAIVFIYTQTTIFVIPPIGAVPEGNSS
jgi:multisubunit Na+/H+ antiporter MnhG subunit